MRQRHGLAKLFACSGGWSLRPRLPLWNREVSYEVPPSAHPAALAGARAATLMPHYLPPICCERERLKLRSQLWTQKDADR